MHISLNELGQLTDVSTARCFITLQIMGPLTHGPCAELHYFISPQTEYAVNQAAILMAPIAMATGFPNLPSFVT
jgi:hypothetical protein